MLTPLGRITPVYVRTSSVSDLCQYFAALVLHRTIISTQPVLHSFQKFTQMAHCSSFDKDYNGERIPFGGIFSST